MVVEQQAAEQAEVLALEGPLVAAQREKRMQHEELPAAEATRVAAAGEKHAPTAAEPLPTAAEERRAVQARRATEAQCALAVQHAVVAKQATAQAHERQLLVPQQTETAAPAAARAVGACESTAAENSVQHRRRG